MNRPENSPYWTRDVTENFEYYFDITDEKRPLFTPLIFVNQEDSCFLKYRQSFSTRFHSTSKDILNNFLKGYSYLEKYKIKNNRYLVGRGCIFKLEIGEDQIEKITPIVIFCFDEYTNWDNAQGYKIIINTKEWYNPEHKTLKPKLSKLIDTYEENNDIILTNDVVKYCFNTIGKIKFKSIKEQSEFLNNLASEVIEQLNPKLESVEELKEEKAF